MTIQLTDITTGEVAGRGYFDELMRTTKAHLLEEYNAGRITGSDYSTVYLGTFQSNLNNASSTILQYELTNQQILTAQEQVEQAKKQNELLELQKELLQVQIDTGKYQLTELMPLQKEQLQEQIDLLQSQDLGQLAQNAVIEVNRRQGEAQISLTGKQEQMVDQQIITEKTNTETPTAGLAKAQYDKIQKENELTSQRVISEKAQTQDKADGIVETGGLIGKEMALKQMQGESFERDAEQKAAKFYSDILSIVYSTDPASVYADPDAWKFGSTDSTKVVSQLLTGIGVTP